MGDENGGAPKYTKFCMDCGSPVEPEADFCYRCGSKRILSVNPSNNRVVMQKGHCPYCGHDNVPDAGFCTMCGKRIGEFEYVPRANRKLEPIHYLAIFLALLPGAFNVFGLGHLVMRKYSRGIMYLGFTAVILYLLGTASSSTLIIIEVIGLVIYLKQASEMFALVFGN